MRRMNSTGRTWKSWGEQSRQEKIEAAARNSEEPEQQAEALKKSLIAARFGYEAKSKKTQGLSVPVVAPDRGQEVHGQ